MASQQDPARVQDSPNAATACQQLAMSAADPAAQAAFTEAAQCWNELARCWRQISKMERPEQPLQLLGTVVQIQNRRKPSSVR